MRAKALTALLAGLLLALLAGPGCIFSPDDDSGPGPDIKPPSYEFPDTEDKVIKNLRESYRQMDIDAYRDVLHTDYRFKFQQFDIDNLGLPSDHLTREEDLQSTDNLFSGNVAPSGQPAVTSISWSVLEGIGIWENSLNPEFPDSRRRLYNIELSIERPGATTLVIKGEQEFYVAVRDSMHEGTPREYWEILGQIDQTVTD